MKTFLATGVKDFRWGDRVDDLIIEADQVGDEYHSMEDLYRHRMALSAALFNHFADSPRRGMRVWKSKQHSDGTMFEGGYFIVGAETSVGQISYHYKLEHWDKFLVPELERAPEYDGHTAQDVVARLLDLM